MAPQTILAIDQGTTNTKAILVDENGRVLARASQSLSVSYPQPAWVEQDPRALWQTVQAAVAECLAGQAAPTAIGVSNQRESVVLWERATGKPIGPVVVWQCQRGAALCRELTAAGLEPDIRARTGLTIDPMFSASKMRWLLDHTPNGQARAAAGELCLGTIDSWVLFHLTGGQVHACDLTNASRTQLLNLTTQAWDPDLREHFGIPLAALPTIQASSSHFGVTQGINGLPDGVPITSLIGDSHGALYGHAGFQPGAIKATYGTGSSLMSPTATPVFSQNGLSTTVAWGYPSATTFALEGNIYATGAAVEWYGQLLGLTNPAAEIEALAAGVESSDSVYLVPAFVGLGAPHWQSEARGTITGLTRGSGPAHLARATLESIAYQIRDVFDVMQQEAGSPLQVLLADGGASQNNTLMQFQADILDCPILRSTSSDVSALGAAYLAGLAAGAWPDEAAIAALPRPHDRFEPQMAAGRRAELYAGWQAAVARTI
ncbi:MAG: glycerol kinase GlpK [Caldilineaceae bacterium]